MAVSGSLRDERQICHWCFAPLEEYFILKTFALLSEGFDIARRALKEGLDRQAVPQRVVLFFKHEQRGGGHPNAPLRARFQ